MVIANDAYAYVIAAFALVFWLYFATPSGALRMDLQPEGSWQR